MLPNLQKKHCILGGPRASPVYPSGKGSEKIIGVEPFHCKRPHPLLWAGLRAERGKITIPGIPKRLNNCVIFIVYT